MSSKTETKVEDEAAGSEGKARGGGRKKALLLVLAIAVLVLAGVGGAAWFFLSEDGEHTAAAEKPKPKTPPVFVTLDPFVVNLAGEVQHYLQVGIDLKVAEAAVGDQIKAHLPEIRNGVLLLLSSKHAEELGTLEGKNRLRAEIRTEINRPLGFLSEEPASAPQASEPGADGEAPARQEPASDYGSQRMGVQEVLLTSFVIQ